jgi:hypothetical protein
LPQGVRLGEKTMSPQSEEFSLRRPRLLTIVVVLIVAGGITLANLSSEPVTGELITKIASKPEHAYGWPITWYWRVASTVPGTVRLGTSSSTRSVLEWPIARYSPGGLVTNVAIWLLLVAGPAAACQRLLRKYRPRVRCRPRLMTVIVLLAVVVPTVLANMTFETS